MSFKQKAFIRNWLIVGNVLSGNVYGHPMHSDGEFIVSCSVLEVNHNRTRCETRNTVYALENPAGKSQSS